MMQDRVFQLVQPPHGLDRPQARQLLPRETAQGRAEEAQGQLCHCRRCGHIGHQPSFRFPPGRHGQPRSKRMTVRAGIHVFHVSRVYGRTIGHRTTNFNLPPSPRHSTPTPPTRLPRPSRRSNVVPPPGKNNRPHVGMAPPGASSRCSSHESQMLQETEKENG